MAVAPRASRRSELLEFAVLGLLHDSPMHGYELRRQITTALGTFRALSYGSLYPCLRDLVTRGLIRETPAEPAPASARTMSATSASGKRAKIVYELTADGKERFGQLSEQSGPNRLSRANRDWRDWIPPRQDWSPTSAPSSRAQHSTTLTANPPVEVSL